jgi:hypothetical protein
MNESESNESGRKAHRLMLSLAPERRVVSLNRGLYYYFIYNTFLEHRYDKQKVICEN